MERTNRTGKMDRDKVEMRKGRERERAREKERKNAHEEVRAPVMLKVACPDFFLINVSYEDQVTQRDKAVLI
jgi:hypothetical protein